MMLAPGGNALDDEEALARLHEPEASRLADELLLRPDLREALLQADLLCTQRLHLGLAGVERVLRAQIRVRRLPVEERDEHEAAEREQPGRFEAEHGWRVLRRSAKPYARRTATMQAISAVTRISVASSRASRSRAARVASPATARPA